MLKISKSQNVAHTMLDINCPQCRANEIVALTRFIDAVNRNDAWHCYACGCDFTIEFVSQTRAAELLRAPVRSAIELLSIIRNAGDVDMDDFSDEFWQEVDAVLKAAGGR